MGAYAFLHRAMLLAAAAMILFATDEIRAAQTIFCSFAMSPTECGFTEQAKLPGRATIVGIGRDGTTSVGLHTEPGDDQVAGSGEAERNDLLLTAADTGCLAAGACEGVEQWWAHSILFPNDFATPTWQPYVVFNFHHTDPLGQANFHVNFRQRAQSTEYGDLVFTGYGGVPDQGEFEATIAEGGAAEPITKNVWYDFVYHVKWSSSSGGFFDAWVKKPGESTYKRVLAHPGPHALRRPGNLPQARQLPLAGLRSLPSAVPAKALRRRALRTTVELRHPRPRDPRADLAGRCVAGVFARGAIRGECRDLFSSVVVGTVVE